MLGITGFETSANFIEEQEPGVYAKTLRNMIIGMGLVLRNKSSRHLHV